MSRKFRHLAISLITSAALLGIAAFTPTTTGSAAESVAAVRTSEPALLQVPQASGMTIGYAGTTQPEVLVSAQPFKIRTLATFDVATQRWSTYVPGAPAFANTLTSANLTPESIVFAKRTDATTLLWSPPVFAGPPVVPVPEGANTLIPPPPDGLTIGVAGTTDPAVLTAVQLFNVQTINAWDVAQQRYDTYIPGAPAIVNTLTPQTLAAADFVWLKADGGPTGAILFEDTELETALVTLALGHTIPSIGPAIEGKIIDMGKGRFTYLPPKNYFGLDTFTFHMQTKDGLEENTFRLIILPVNDAPEAIEDAAISLAGRTAIIDVLDNDTDAEDDNLSIFATTQPLGGIVAVADGVLTYTPLSGFSGTDSFTYEVTDGIATPGTNPQSIGTVSVIVSKSFGGVPFFGGGGGGPIAGPPPDDGSGGGGGGDETQAVSLIDDELYIETCAGDVAIDVLSNDTGDGVTALAIASISAPTLGTATNAGTSVTYTPPVDCTGDDAFTYTVLDSSEVEHSASISVHLNQPEPAAGGGAEPTNQLPSAVDDTASTFETTPVTIDLLANDSDPDDDAISITTIGEPDFGTLVDNGDGTITYTAPTYYGGTVTFTYTISDGVSGESTATVQITVTRGAVSARVPIVVYSGSSVTVQVIDPSDSDLAQLESVTEGSHGTISMNQTDGTFTYQPESGFVGSDWISWTLLFSFGGTAETTVQIDIIN